MWKNIWKKHMKKTYEKTYEKTYLHNIQQSEPKILAVQHPAGSPVTRPRSPKNKAEIRSQKAYRNHKRHTVVGRCTLQGVQSVGKPAVFNLPKKADIRWLNSPWFALWDFGWKVFEVLKRFLKPSLSSVLSSRELWALPDGLATALSKNLSFTLLYVSSANEAKPTSHKSTYQESDRRERVERTLADLSLFSWKRIWLRSCGSLHLQSPCERMHADFLPLVKLLEHPLFILFKLEPRGTKS